MIKCIEDRGQHNIVVALKDIGVNCLDIQNGDLPWRQFQEGIWLYAHPESIGANKRESIYIGCFKL